MDNRKTDKMTENIIKLMVLPNDQLRHANDNWEICKTAAQVQHVLEQKRDYAFKCLLLSSDMGDMSNQTRQDLIQHSYQEFLKCNEELAEILQEYAYDKVISSVKDLYSRNR